MPLANIDRSTPHLPKGDHSEARVYYVDITYSFMSVCRLQKWQTDAALYPLSSGTDLPRRTQKLHFSAPYLAGLRRSWLCVPPAMAESITTARSCLECCCSATLGGGCDVIPVAGETDNLTPGRWVAVESAQPLCP